MRVVDLNRDEWKMIMDHAQGMGRDGDTKLVHINNAEEKMLKEAGGRGTVNPKTGLKEYSPMGGQAGGSDGTGKGKSPGGGTGNGGGGKFGKDSSQTAVGEKESISGPGKGFTKEGSGKASDMTKTGTAFAQKNKAKAVKDYQDEENTFFDEIGNFFSGMFGVREMNPEDQDLTDFLSTDKAQWGLDPIAAGLAVAGALNPVASVISKLYGGAVTMGAIEPHMVGFGTDRFGPNSDDLGFGDKKAANSSGASGGKKGGTGGIGEKSTGNRPPYAKPPTALPPIKTATPATPAEPTPVKTPGEILLEKYQLPGINAPWALQPNTIDRSQHNAIVQQAMQRRVDTSGDN